MNRTSTSLGSPYLWRAGGGDGASFLCGAALLGGDLDLDFLPGGALDLDQYLDASRRLDHPVRGVDGFDLPVAAQGERSPSLGEGLVEFSELVANAVRYGRTDKVTVEVDVSGDVFDAVHDRSPDLPSPGVPDGEA